MSTKNLLVVDDSATTRMLITLTLKKSDAFRIIEASDGTEAVKKLDTESIDIVLTDIHMPKMDGLELITHIRSKQAKQALPIIVITTMGEETDRDKGLELGANAYILKPISGAKLQSLVKELLD
jgi:CheY-like chemotaxis protein